MDRNYYVDGNVVRELGAQPIRREPQRTPEEREQIKREKNRRNAIRRNREKALGMRHDKLVFLTLCAIVCAVGVGLYVNVMSTVAYQTRNIASLESELANLKASNEERYKTLSTSVDLDYVKDVAINQLGMTYATEDQIVYYSVDKNNYMDQYRDIP